jgi:hypothetical protein
VEEVEEVDLTLHLLQVEQEIHHQLVRHKEIQEEMVLLLVVVHKLEEEAEDQVQQVDLQ